MLRRFPVFAVCSLVLSQSLLAGNKPEPEEVVSKLREASAKTNIFELPSFLLRAKVAIDEGSVTEVGAYKLIWNGPDRWREEIVLPKYHELQIGGKGQVWVRRTTDFIPLAVYRIHQALGFGSTSGSAGVGNLIRFTIPQNAAFKKQHRWKEHGDPLTCFEFEHEFEKVAQTCGNSPSDCFPDKFREKRTLEACLNDRTGTLARDYRFFDDEDMQPVGAKTFPRSLRFLWRGGTVAKITISELQSPIVIPPEAFAVPPGIPPQSGCMNPDPPQLIKRVDPSFNEITAKTPPPWGAADVLIGTDGSVKLNKVIDLIYTNSQVTLFEKTALAGWRYEPATCNGSPTRINTVID